MNNQIENSCTKIIQTIKSSSLNFTAQETPFSLYVTIRKSLVKKYFNCENVDQNENSSENVTDLDVLRSKCNILEAANKALKCEVDLKLKTIEKKDSLIENLKRSQNDANNKLEETLKVNSEKECKANMKKLNKLSNEVTKKVTVIEKLKDENDALKKELESSGSTSKKNAKLLKEKDKELHDLRKENQTTKDKFNQIDAEYSELKCTVNRERKENQRKEKSKAKKDFLNNLKSESQQQSDFMCDLCDEKCDSVGVLKLHIKSVHFQNSTTQTEEKTTEEKQAQTVPESPFVSKEHPNSEVSRFRFDKPNSCNQCGKLFCTELRLKEHMKTDHEHDNVDSQVRNLMAFPVGFPSTNWHSWPPQELKH